MWDGVLVAMDGFCKLGVGFRGVREDMDFCGELLTFREGYGLLPLEAQKTASWAVFLTDAVLVDGGGG